jgi:hypothetical protein
MKLLTRRYDHRYLQDKSPSLPLARRGAGGRSGRPLADAAVRREHDIASSAREARRVALAQTRRAQKGHTCYDKCATHYDVIR